MSIIAYLNISKFRSVPRVKLPIGTKLTVIAGRNATCKSTILAMLGQPFGLRNESDIFGNPFRTEFSEIFKLSQQFDIPGEHEYTVGLLNSIEPYGFEAPVKSYQRSRAKSHIRFVVGKKRVKGYGNIEIPVSYLGLKRLFPIGETENLTINPSQLIDNEISWFTKWYRKIMASNQIRSIESLNSKREKQTLAITENSYDSTAISAGQDNLGRILGAIISFQRLRKKLGTKYKGGILLIDEIDAAMHSASQNRLVDLFYNVADNMKLQIIVTTHSRDFINAATTHAKTTTQGTVLLYFSRIQGKLCLTVNPSPEFMTNDLKLLLAPRPRKAIIPKISLYSEDKEARLFLRSIVPKDVYARLSVVNKSFGKGDLKSLAQLSDRIEELQNAVFVLDGDCEVHQGYHHCIVTLPGAGKSPENLFFDFLDSLDDENIFWQNPNGYTKDHFNDRIPTSRDRASMKEWFNKSLTDGCWGKAGQLLFYYWLQENQQIVEEFNARLVEAVNYVAQKKGIPIIETVKGDSLKDTNTL